MSEELPFGAHTIVYRPAICATRGANASGGVRRRHETLREFHYRHPQGKYVIDTGRRLAEDTRKPGTGEWTVVLVPGAGAILVLSV